MGALDEVLGLAAQGRRLFPCGPQAKTPLLKGWPTLASSDPATIQKWDVKYPGCNWGVATGRVSGLFVLDVDSEKGRASLATLEAHHRPLPPTLTSRTGRVDGGEHGYFFCPEGAIIRCSTGKIGEGLDVRGDGGYAIVPPSVHESGRAYEWIDPDAIIAEASPWLLEMVTDSRSKIGPEASQTIPQGRRNVTLTSRAGKMRRRGMTQEEIEAALLVDNASCCRPPLPQDEVRGIARSVSRYEPASRPNARQPLRDFLLSARDKNNLDFICRSKWMSSMFVFARLLKGRAEFARMAGLEAVQRIEQELEDPWELFADVCDDPRAQLVADWDKVHTAASDDTLSRAWFEAHRSPVLQPHVYSDKYCQFISLIAALQRIVGGGVPIGLPLKRIGELLCCHWTMVGKYRKWAVQDGILQESAQYVRHQRAAEYLSDLSKVLPVSPEVVSPNSHTSIRTRTPRPTNDLVRTHIVSGENQITSGENAPSKAPAGTASDPGYVEIVL